MRISEVEIHEFTYDLESVGMAYGHQVYDPGSTLEQPGFVLTVRTADGLEGHYRGFLFVPPMVTQIKMAAGGFLLGRDPFEREGIWQDLWVAFRHTDHLGIGPIDIALWDLAGKHYGAPIAELLGGYREEIKAYASTMFMDTAPDGLNSPEAYAEHAAACNAEGYPAYKIHGHPGGDPAVDRQICQAVAERVGDEMELMLDPASEYTTFGDALQVGRTLDELGFFWYEDPLAETGQSIHMNRRLQTRLKTPILGLEHVRTGPFGRVDHLKEAAADFIRGDVHLDGGITGVMKLANIVEGFGLDIELHVGGPATLHCLGAIRNTNFFEHALLHPRDIDWMSARGYTAPIEVIDDGMAQIPDDPGLGATIDWDFVDRTLTDTTVIDTDRPSGVS